MEITGVYSAIILYGGGDGSKIMYFIRGLTIYYYTILYYIVKWEYYELYSRAKMGLIYYFRVTTNPTQGLMSEFKKIRSLY